MAVSDVSRCEAKTAPLTATSLTHRAQFVAMTDTPAFFSSPAEVPSSMPPGRSNEGVTYVPPSSAAAAVFEVATATTTGTEEPLTEACASWFGLRHGWMGGGSETAIHAARRKWLSSKRALLPSHLTTIEVSPSSAVATLTCSSPATRFDVTAEFRLVSAETTSSNGPEDADSAPSAELVTVAGVGDAVGAGVRSAAFVSDTLVTEFQ